MDVEQIRKRRRTRLDVFHQYRYAAILKLNAIVSDNVVQE